MPIRQIVLEGDPGLLKESRRVTEFNRRIHQLLDDMRETLHNEQGAGLAAPQVGVLRQVCIVMLEDETILEMINPEIIGEEGEQNGLEGCLSIPGVRGMVRRPMKVRVRAQDRNGEFFEAEAEGFTARGFCHEIDHLHGRLYTSLATELYDLDNLPEEDDEE